ncbi:MAG: alpha/beta family hydrolase [Solirubrobacteraceae bacterium]
MATWEKVCELVEALPGTELDTGRDNPAWRVNGKVLIRRNPRMRVPDEEAIRLRRGELIAIRAERGEREALLQEDPETFFITPHWETNPSVLAWLADVEVEQLRELIVEAWLAKAPKRLVREWESRSSAAPAPSRSPEIRDVPTPHGPARVYIHPALEPVGALVLGHGAGGRVNAPDLMAAVEAAEVARFLTVLVEQPYRVAGRRAPAPARQLDDAWKAVVSWLRDQDQFRDLPLVVGGRSAGARVACRTAAECGAVAVMCLAFPLKPPRRSTSPESAVKTRQDELDAVSVPMLVVQGASDQFGVPGSSNGRRVVTVSGNHSLTGDLTGVGAAVAEWLPGVISAGSHHRRSPAPAR